LIEKSPLYLSGNHSKTSDALMSLDASIYRDCMTGHESCEEDVMILIFERSVIEALTKLKAHILGVEHADHHQLQQQRPDSPVSIIADAANSAVNLLVILQQVKSSTEVSNGIRLLAPCVRAISSLASVPLLFRQDVLPRFLGSLFSQAEKNLLLSIEQLSSCSHQCHHVLHLFSNPTLPLEALDRVEALKLQYEAMMKEDAV
jgi:hypothetical protein